MNTASVFDKNIKLNRSEMYTYFSYAFPGCLEYLLQRNNKENVRIDVNSISFI